MAKQWVWMDLSECTAGPTVFMPEYAKKSIYCMTILAKMIIKGLLKALVGHSFLNSAALK